MRCEKGATAYVIMDVLHDGPGQGYTIVGARSSADFIENDQAAIRGRVQDASRFSHLDHEGTLPSR